MFYAENNRYGIGSMTVIRRHGREITVSAGTLYRFKTRQDRDAWVEDPGGWPRRQALAAAEARKGHATGDLARAIWDYPFTLDGGYDDSGPEVFIEPAPRG